MNHTVCVSLYLLLSRCSKLHNVFDDLYLRFLFVHGFRYAVDRHNLTRHHDTNYEYRFADISMFRTHYIVNYITRQY